MQRLCSNTIDSAYRRYERHPVSCEIDGEVLTGNYWIAGMILVVSTATGAQAGNWPTVSRKIWQKSC
jgi:hypothetical protein